MAFYKEKKKLALGYVLPAPNPFNGGEFTVQPSIAMQSTGYNEFYGKTFAGLEGQVDYKVVLEVWDEYEPDRRAARKNLARVSGMLLADDVEQLEQLLARKPAADWLNCIFLEEEETDNLVGAMKAASPECRSVITAALTKELERLVNFKTLFERMLNELKSSD
ncbi:MAG: hypothetical protein LBL42_04065 [Tannerella sp.]|jgi:hypothetical protein|nr:hypothetical protein [Tannerella sp.]